MALVFNCYRAEKYPQQHHCNNNIVRRALQILHLGFCTDPDDLGPGLRSSDLNNVVAIQRLNGNTKKST